jgi:flagellar basal body rod protein FlgG
MKVVDTIANNLANANTTGFKRDFGVIFEHATGVDARTHIDVTPGELINTDNDLDVAIHGSGFFVVETPNGTRYTRSGNFSLNANGELVTKDAMKVLSASGAPIVIGEGKVEIQDGGVVTVDGNEVATLKIVTFSDPVKLQKEGFQRMVYNGSAEEVQAVSDPQVKGRFLERSNVNTVDEMVHLMSAYREFEAVQRTLKTMMTDMNSKLIQELGRLS